MKSTRRKILKAGAQVAAASSLAGFTASSYARILGANERMNLCFAGLGGRGQALIGSAMQAGKGLVHVHSLCDVDSRNLKSVANSVRRGMGHAPVVDKDYRRLIENKEIDAVVIATPDHSHAPFAVYALQQGHHVYIEKPCSHNPREGEILVEAAKHFNKVVQMGNQQRSAPTSIEIINQIHDGIIGRAYMGKAWYSNSRGSIGTGKKIAVPDWLDWDLWQGPAPRRDYKDNYVHYKWHWFKHWGTGEVNNNGLHELDICRWALDVKHPERVSSTGGRFHYNDDWEFYDTQIASYEFPGNKSIAWEGRSCNEFFYYDRGRGATIYGTEGTVMLDRNGYFLYDLEGNLIKSVAENNRSGTTDTVGAGPLVDFHFENFYAAIRENAKLNSPIDEGVISTHMCHLANISQDLGRDLKVNPETGRVVKDRQAKAQWGREYQKGWAPKI